MVVCALNEEDALKTPTSNSDHYNEELETFIPFKKDEWNKLSEEMKEGMFIHTSWVDKIKDLKITLIGIAEAHTEIGVVLVANMGA